MASSESAQTLPASPDIQHPVLQSREEESTRQDAERRDEVEAARQEVAAEQVGEALSDAAAARKDVMPPADDPLMLALFGPPTSQQPLLELPTEPGRNPYPAWVVD